jgi:hypothetical protein
VPDLNYWHCPVAKLQVKVIGHEPVVQWQPRTPLMVPQTGVWTEQTTQLLPFAPQSLFDMPDRQMLPLLQQPVPPQLPQLNVPPHPSDTEPHCPDMHVFGVHPHLSAIPPPPHVSGAVQSEFVAHPQVPAAVHACPAGEEAQLTHDPPAGPHAVGVVPL